MKPEKAMTRAKELLDAADLQGAIDCVTSEVKANPLDMQRRTLLFELLCFAGEFDRAERQLEVIGSQSAQSQIGVQVYRNNIEAERRRKKLFADGLEPHFLIPPPAYVDLLMSATNRVREGNTKEARALLDRVEEESPARRGLFNGRQFQHLRDWNDFTSPVLELFVRSDYAWLPFEQIRRIEISAPRHLRDLMWTPARIEARDGTIGEVYIPALYANSDQHANDLVRLGRMTDWKSLDEDLFIPQGLRVFMVDDEYKSLLEARSIEFVE
ncbi:MAG: type VI secretion system accessory protein TagJ [Acidobacteriota bacterium]